MLKRILIISSDNTGHGHKSITESLSEVVTDHMDAKVYVVDGFSLGGKLLRSLGNCYSPITRKAELLWKWIWKLTAMKAPLVNRFIEDQIKDDILVLLNKVKPDVILSVHPNFNGSVLNIMEKYSIKIPFITLIADLVNIYPLWADPRADYIICPTDESRDKCLEYAVPSNKLKMFGFPVRARFFRKKTNPKVNYQPGRPLNCLIMSGGEGVGNMERIALTLLRHFHCKVIIVAGRNRALKRNLEQSLRDYRERVEVHGFTHNIQDLMFASDVAFTRASPNVMYEAVATNTPLVITGALSGQEEDNPRFVEQHNLGVVCEKIEDIKSMVDELIMNQGEKQNRIIASQRNFIDENAALNVAQFILDVGEARLHKSNSQSLRTSKVSVVSK